MALLSDRPPRHRLADRGVNQGEILAALSRVLDSAREALLARDDDRWLDAMYNFRGFSSDGSQLIFDKRLAEHRAKGLSIFGTPLPTKPQQRLALDASTLEDLLNS